MSDRRRAGRPPRTTAEWWAFGVSLALIVAVAAVILASWAIGPDGPPVLRARATGAPQAQGSSYRVPFEVENTGGEAATNVQVVAQLLIDGELAGDGEQGIMFLSAGERERGAFLFEDDPARGDLSIRVASYARP